MHDPVGVGEGHTEADTTKDREQPVPAVLLVRAGLAGAALLEHVPQAHTLHGFHGKKTLARRQHADVVDRHDARVLQASGDAGLHHEAVAREFVVAVLVVEHLQRDLPLEHPVEGEHDPAHAAAGELLLDGVALGAHIGQGDQVGGLGAPARVPRVRVTHLPLEDGPPVHRQLDALQHLHGALEAVGCVSGRRGLAGGRHAVVRHPSGGRGQTRRVHRESKADGVQRGGEGEGGARRQSALAEGQSPAPAAKHTAIPRKEALGQLAHPAGQVPDAVG